MGVACGVVYRCRIRAPLGPVRPPLPFGTRHAYPTINQAAQIKVVNNLKLNENLKLALWA